MPDTNNLEGNYQIKFLLNIYYQHVPTDIEISVLVSAKGAATAITRALTMLVTAGITAETLEFVSIDYAK